MENEVVTNLRASTHYHAENSFWQSCFFEDARKQ